MEVEDVLQVVVEIRQWDRTAQAVLHGPYCFSLEARIFFAERISDP